MARPRRYPRAQSPGPARTTPDPKPATPDTISYRILDHYTFVHAAIGAAARAVDISAPKTFGAMLLFEIVEPTLKRKKVFEATTIERPINRVGDLAATMAGWYLADRLK